MYSLQVIVDYCQQRLKVASTEDYTGAFNGLQVANNGQVTQLGMAVDAGVLTIQKAIQQKVDCLLVHHGLFWGGIKPLIKGHYEKYKLLFEHNLAVYACHWPLDIHEEIGNNILLARQFSSSPKMNACSQKTLRLPLGASFEGNCSREELKSIIAPKFPKMVALEFGPSTIKRVGVMTGGSGALLEEFEGSGIETWIIGELKHSQWALAQELKLNIYACGHYATEVFGVQALGEEVSRQFKIPSVFLDIDCPL